MVQDFLNPPLNPKRVVCGRAHIAASRTNKQRLPRSRTRVRLVTAKIVKGFGLVFRVQGFEGVG